jgi:hypothetical protein
MNMDSNICLYATEYHLRLLRNAGLDGEFIQIGHRPMGLRRRLMGFVRAVRRGLLNPASRVYLPRSATKDAWLLYRIFRRRSTLISDGISDCLEFVPVLCIGPIRLGFHRPVADGFDVLSVQHPVRDVRFSNDGAVAIFTKRGRDVDYVTPVAERLFPDSVRVVNPTAGSFAWSIMPASTLVFELGLFPRDRLCIVRCEVADERLPEARRALLRAYEDFLESQGYRLIGRSELAFRRGARGDNAGFVDVR